MIVALGNDHMGFPAKQHVREVLERLGHEVIDLGAQSTEPVDFPIIARGVCEAVLDGRAARAVMVCESGVGASIAANKMRGIRSTVAHDTYSARQSVEHDDVNVLCMGAWVAGPAVMTEVVTAYMGAEFSTDEERRRRVRQLDDMDATTSSHPDR